MIKVCNAIMGSGKSSAAITYINENPEEKFIYITPFLEEAHRIKSSCPQSRFVEPNSKIGKYHFRKIIHTEALIEEGRNITTTHQAFKRYTKDMLKRINELGYTLIIDENVDVLDKMKASSYDLKLVIDNGFMKEEDGVYRITDKKYEGEALKYELLDLAKSRDLIKVTDSSEILYYWTLPADLLSSFKDVYILTYMFESQSLYKFIRMNDLPFEYIGVEKDKEGVYRFIDHVGKMPEYVKSLGEKIHILDNCRMNSIGADKYALSISWYQRDGSDVEQLKNNIANCYKNVWDVPTSKRLWGTYKTVFGKTKGKGYTKAFLCFNSKALNSFRDRTCLVYAVNVFMNVSEKKFYEKFGIEVNEDDYALSIMLQWIWRSAIRDGKDIYIYIPSKRMRTLLVNWINSVGREVDMVE